MHALTSTPPSGLSVLDRGAPGHKVITGVTIQLTCQSAHNALNPLTDWLPRFHGSPRAPATLPVPTSLLERADGTALREAWRQFLHSSVMPVSLSVSAELSEKLDTDIRLSFDRMFASDLNGRARAFQSMVGGGMDVQKAAALAGLMDPNE